MCKEVSCSQTDSVVKHWRYCSHLSMNPIQHPYGLLKEPGKWILNRQKSKRLRTATGISKNSMQVWPAGNSNDKVTVSKRIRCSCRDRAETKGTRNTGGSEDLGGLQPHWCQGAPCLLLPGAWSADKLLHCSAALLVYVCCSLRKNDSYHAQLYPAISYYGK